MESTLDTPRTPSAHPAHASIESQIRYFEELLANDFVDLSRLGREIHARPELENLVFRLTVVLGLAAEASCVTAEESIVLLGTGRIRALIYLWFVLQFNRLSSTASGNPTDRSRIEAMKISRKETNAASGTPLVEPGADSSEDLFSDLLALLERCR